MQTDQELDKKLALASARKCDKYDYLLAVASGAIAGLVDIFLVGSPGDSVLGNWSDAQTDKVVMRFAQTCGWKENGSVASAIGFLEKKFPVNYDQRYSSDVDGAFPMNTRNHHIKSLAHSPDPIGLFFSILDQFQGTATFISNGQLIQINTDDSGVTLRGGNFWAKLFAGFCNWIGHIMSDVAGSSGGRGGSGRGSGIGIPFYELFLCCNFGSIQIGQDRQTFAELMTRVFQSGYDFRFGVAMSIPVVLNELLIRAVWAIKQHYYHGVPWEKCVPSQIHGDLRWMLIVGNATLCIFDGVDAAIRSKGNPIIFVLRLNLIAWFKLILMILKEVMIRYSFTYEDLRDVLCRINRELEAYVERLKAIDYASYQQELNDIQNLNHLLQSNNSDTSAIYQFLEKQGASLQFHSFDEFDQKMQDENFILEI